jgi:hypothetical protein
MESESEASLKDCMLKLKETALNLALTHHKIKHDHELAHITREVADSLACVSSLALIIQSTLTK